MKKVFIWLGLVTFILSGSPGSVYAIDGSDFVISGFVDSSWLLTTDIDGVNNAGPLADTNGFGLDQVEINITKEIKDLASLRLDLNYFPNSGMTNSDDAIIEQGYLTLKVSENATLTFGKFNAPIGFELLDPVDMYQFSHALVFNYGIPTNLVGGMVSTSFGDTIDVNFYLVNGWDNEPDGNKDKSYGGRIGITPMEGVNFGFSGITGEDGAAGETLSVIDIDGTITMIPQFTLGMEFNFGWDDMTAGTGADDATWFGFLLMAHYDYAEWGGITFRYDYFNDEDGAGRLPGGVAAPADIRKAITISPTFIIAEGFGALIEYRHDFSNKNVFVEGDTGATLSDGSDILAFEMTYAF